jgi:hypothetical protein
MSNDGAASRAAVPISSARAEASRKNGAKSRGPKTLEGKARSAQNALKHGLRAQKYVVLPEEDAAEFAGLEAAMIEELAPAGALQTVLARRVVVAAWRLARADRIEVELFAERRFRDGGLGNALIRDGNGCRSFETLLRYRGAAMAEFWRALKTLKALQAAQAADADTAQAAHPAGAGLALEARRSGAITRRRGPNEPELRGTPCETIGWGTTGPEPRRTLHEPAAPWTPNEPEPRCTLPEPAAARQPNRPAAGATVNGPEVRRSPREMTTWLAPNEPEPQRQETAADGRPSTRSARRSG